MSDTTASRTPLKVLVYSDDVNVGVAVALDWGLIVPVVQRAQSKTLFELSEAIADFDRAIQLDPNLAAAHLNLGDAAERMGWRPDPALQRRLRAQDDRRKTSATT